MDFLSTFNFLSKKKSSTHLGEDSVHAKGLHEALRIARARSTLVSERVESCKKSDSATQRVVRAQDVIEKATAKSSRGGGGRGRAKTCSTPGRSHLLQACGTASTSVNIAGSDRCTDSTTRCRSLSVGVREEIQVTGPPCIEATPPMLHRS